MSIHQPSPMPPLFDPPLLEPGDCLSREEFERRYDGMPGLKKAELINGVVYMPSPVRMDQHAEPHAHMIGWLAAYVAATPGVRFGDNASVRIDNQNMPQPDILLFVEASRGGQSRLSDDGYIEGAPELVVEIASSSVSFDLHTKYDMYQRSGIQEYVVWRVLDGAVDWFVRERDGFERAMPADDGIMRSRVFPGLWLEGLALLRGDLARVMDVVRLGTASEEHATFCRSK